MRRLVLLGLLWLFCLGSIGGSVIGALIISVSSAVVASAISPVSRSLTPTRTA